MAVEIERKFLVTSDAWKSAGKGKVYRQGYISAEHGRTVRVRTAGDRAWITIKGESKGISRSEFEYEIPGAEAQQILTEICQKPLIEKTRTVVHFQGFDWEVDEFAGENEGLVVAEIELPDENTVFEKPHWIGREVSADYRYANSSLSKNPYRNWKNEVS